MAGNLDAILRDFDGTMVDSARKNIATTRSILSVVAPHLSGEKSEVISVAVAYSGATPDTWSVKADHVAHEVSDLYSIIGQHTRQ